MLCGRRNPLLSLEQKTGHFGEEKNLLTQPRIVTQII
jgi:hypothetical protein